MENLEKKQCRYCDEALPESFLDLGSMPLANSLVPQAEKGRDEFSCPLRLTRCLRCGLVQLTHVVPPDLMFKHYLYVSSTTKTFQVHFADYAKVVRKKLKSVENPVSVDIGSNDGLLVSECDKQGMVALGVDPATNLAEAANKQGRRTLNRYFDEECVKQITRDYGKAHAITANNVFAHIDDIQSVCRNVHDLLDDDGIFVIEFPYLLTMLADMTFDMIYHEHVSYIALNPLKFILNRYSMKIFDVQRVSSHGGSLRVFCQKLDGPYKARPIVQEMLSQEKMGSFLTDAPYIAFADRVRALKDEFMSVIADLKRNGKTVAGYGAPAKASTIVNFYGLTPEHIDFVVDDNPLKQDHLIPGAQIPIVSSAHLNEKPTDYVVIFAWNFAREILKKVGNLREKGVEFLVPVRIPGDQATFSCSAH